MIKSVEISIGGRVIDRQYADWINVWSQLTENSTKQPILNIIYNKKYSSTFDLKYVINVFSNSDADLHPDNN
uniref:Major capsid protein N-terminal domain-containing protein n=1 Tax=viral metagenome TaxID=1070528 RepID=A0A6C0EAY7_9ZZZZ